MRYIRLILFLALCFFAIPGRTQALELLNSPRFENPAQWGTWNGDPPLIKNASLTSMVGKLVITYTYNSVTPANAKACWLQDITNTTTLASLQGKTVNLRASVQRSDAQYSSDPATAVQVYEADGGNTAYAQNTFSFNENTTKNVLLTIPSEPLQRIRVQFCLWDSYETSGKTNKIESITLLSLTLPDPTPTDQPLGVPTAPAAPTTDWIGINQIQPPSGGGKDYVSGLTSFINAALQLIFLGFGLYALFTFILASYYFLSSQGKQENVDKARKMFTYAAIGLVILASSFIGGAIIGKVFFNDWYFILDPSTTISCTLAEQQNNRLKTCTGTAPKTAEIDAARAAGEAQTCKNIYEQLQPTPCP